jgi:Protein of unknown function (DUF2442)
MAMMKIVRAKWVKDHVIALAFSDGSEGDYEFASLLVKDTPLTLPLKETPVFQRFFLELGALCWPNGLEFSAAKLHNDVLAANRLHKAAIAA